MSTIKSKITSYTKKQENTAYLEKTNQLMRTDLDAGTEKEGATIVTVPLGRHPTLEESYNVVDGGGLE
jgi:hypothetical protein